MQRLKKFFKQETVLCVSFILAVVSAFVVHPDSGYLAYPDYRTLALLFCLMLIVAGLRALGVFDLLGQSLIRRARSLRMLYATLVLLCFFTSMLITNDVALITFVPFSILVFQMIDEEDRVLKLIVLETIAANLGSMATPIGNPQNLYLYSVSEMPFSDFAWAVWPYTALSLILLLISFRGVGETSINQHFRENHTDAGHTHLAKSIMPYLVLLLLCLLVVFRVLPYAPVLVICTVTVFIINPKLFDRVDYGLLGTFLCFFIFIGNMKRIPEVSALLISLVSGRELGVGIITSQIISNVPAAILLSGFTDNLTTLCTAVNLGGLGTLIASLASLISFKFFSKEYPHKKGAFLKIFTLWNVGFLIILTLLAVMLGA